MKRLLIVLFLFLLAGCSVLPSAKVPRAVVQAHRDEGESVQCARAQVEERLDAIIADWRLEWSKRQDILFDLEYAKYTDENGNIPLLEMRRIAKERAELEVAQDEKLAEVKAEWMDVFTNLDNALILNRAVQRHLDSVGVLFGGD